ncbi:YihY/virulence factor BrkB family protein [Roseivivax sp. GX 12232]|uniref:YihY/virulence factor BrkB family protein n=1 Tax=Roseivivax sp. GX 12232 TaxID=2900547 RepID=UPI001E3726B0|nr:YihY/virulence factor BrkB family protein [Roseivivax sp. GX 12232]MCE0504581.1 YihY/virulence factor BrkB family protein [Roseivivax sp. GX 12232]
MTKHPGSDAATPLQMPSRGWWQILRRVYADTIDDNVLVIAAGVAFFGLLAIFPAVTALISVAGYALDPTDVANELDELATLLPENAALIIQDQVIQVTGASETANGLLSLFSLLLAIYGATRGVKTLMAGINVAYGERERRGFLRLNLTAYVLTVVLIFGVLVSLAMMIGTPAALAFLGLSRHAETLVFLAQFSLLAAMSVGGLAFLYRYAPSRRAAKWRWVLPGAVLSTFLWMLGTSGFSVYAQNFASYNETYGALGGVIILLTWMWLSAFIILLGAEVNAELEYQTRRDSTRGRDRPEGKRGAAKADRYPERYAAH